MLSIRAHRLRFQVLPLAASVTASTAMVVPYAFIPNCSEHQHPQNMGFVLWISGTLGTLMVAEVRD